MIKPEFYKPKPVNLDKYPLPVYAQPKFDGHRLLIGQGKALTTVGTDLAPKLRWLLQDKLIESDFLIDGELYVPFHTAEYVKTAIVEKSVWLTFIAFATDALPPETLLETVREWFVERDIRSVGFMCTHELRNMYGAISDKVLLEKLGSKTYPPHLEGYVFKAGNYANWQKWKAESTVDLVVTGFVPGAGKYFGLIGALEVSTSEGYVVATVSGMTDLVRAQIDEDTDLGRVVEVKYQRVGTNGRLRHPRFLRWRDDKTRDQCGVDQDPSLAKWWEENR